MAEGKSVTPAFLYAALHWPQVHHRWQELAAEGHGHTQSLTIASHETLDLNQQFIAIPKRFCATIREIWDLQVKLEKRHGRRPDSTLEHPRFRAGYDFLLLRERSGEIMAGLGEWWTNYQVSDESQRRELVASLEENFEEHQKRLKNINDVTDTIFLGLGSNLDQPIRQIHRAIESLGEFVDSIERANLYRSKPLGPQDQPDFINTVIKGQTSLSPEDLLGSVKRIEKYQQRVETVRWGPRTIDIDILYFGNLNFTSRSLKIPHPEILKRSFVTIPLLDLLTTEITPTGDRIDRNRYDPSALVRVEIQEEKQWL